MKRVFFCGLFCILMRSFGGVVIVWVFKIRLHKGAKLASNSAILLPQLSEH